MILLIACSGSPDTAAPTDPSPDPPEATDSAAPDTSEPPPLARLTEAEDLNPAEDIVEITLTAAPATHTFVDADGTAHTVEGYAYNGISPGPLIRARRGDTLTVTLTNNLDEPTTIHWHGLDVPYSMDGVTWSKDPIFPGETFTYNFTIEQAGTFWYHPHFNTDSQVSGGLYGAIVVEDPDDPAVDEDLVLLIDDWDLHGTATDEHDHHAAEGVWTVNGQVQPTLALTGGSTLRVRILNVSNLGYLDLTWPDIRQIGSDQGLSALTQPDSIVLAPGDRAEAEWLIGTDGFSLTDQPYVHQGGSAWGEASALMNVEITEPAAAPDSPGWPFPSEPPSEDPGHTDITYVFSGARETGVWLLNGAVFPNIDIDEVSLGDTAIIEVRNLSPAEHPYHLHGLSFEVLSIDGVAPTHRRIEDTLNVGIYSTVRLRIEADNPGDWMSHCHILPHAEGGMMTVLRVAGSD